MSDNSSMNKQYGKLLNETGTYAIDKIPESGSFEFIYKNKKILLKVDQFGPSFVQIVPPNGMTVLQRKERETYSPWKCIFSVNGKIYNNFDIFAAKKFLITFKPEKCIYDLTFTNFKCTTELFIDAVDEVVVSKIIFKKISNKSLNLKFLDVASFECFDTTMAIWDKKTWYMKTSFSKKLDEPYYEINHFSVNGIKEDRKSIFYALSKPVDSIEMSYERLISQTSNFQKICKLNNRFDDVFVYEQICGSYFEETLNDEFTYTSVFRVGNYNDKFGFNKLSEYFSTKYQNDNFNKLTENFNKVNSVRKIETKDRDFNKFVNEFLPQEISWVIDLDRGWASGMRGTRDCANDFLGYIDYDKEKTRATIVSILKNQRYSDGWFPRQIPFGNNNKYDMREFTDSACFFIELFYEYLCSTNDYSLLTDTYKYLDNAKEETGIEHLIKAAMFYTMKENIGEHGLIKLKGGDWLDCLNRVGLKGRGETLMVTCQAILAFDQVTDVLENFSTDYTTIINKFKKQKAFFKKNIKKYCLTDDGFYRSLFSDDGKWYFSEKDVDGVKRVYVPSNAYAIISDVYPRNNKKVVNAILKNNKSSYGLKLFTYPFGITPIDGLGKMGTGDFFPYALENGSVYNHGSQLFFLRALAKIGDYKNFYNVLNYALPYNQKFHCEKDSCAPMYAVTNCYSLSDAFPGRSAFIFLTGSIAMVYRAIYNWMFGISFSMKNLIINPCLPKQYGDSLVSLKFGNKQISVKYVGFGNKIKKIVFNNCELKSDSKYAKIDKGLLQDKNEIIVNLI